MGDNSHLRIGAEGEKAAMEFLRARGYLVVDRNWRSGHHELDIVATTPDGNYHFVEVKTRKMDSLVGPTEAITPRKVRNLVAAANHFIQAHAIDTEAFIDLVAVEADPASGEFAIELIPDIANCRW